MGRSLPKKNNPLILEDEAPVYEELLARRRLGKTHLAVKPTQIGTSNATKPENLGPFEYAHLRAPLPKDLKGSEIFPSHSPQQHPETYFLMRRSKDGFVSATGMFKIAFPWAKLDEERSERDYLKARDNTSEDEIAGNVWISPVLALELAKEYKMYDWVRALLDPTEIVQSPSSAKKQIAPPPRFELPSVEPTTTQPHFTPPQMRTRRGRSASPSKKSVSPRKSRQTRAQKEANAAATSAANASLQSSLDSTAETADESVNGTIQQSVEVDEEKTVMEEKVPEPASEEAAEEEENKDVEAKKTTVSIEMPLLPNAPPTEDTEKMIAKAKEMVQEAVQIPAESSLKDAQKRKVDDLSEDEEDEETRAASTQRAKRARVLEDKLKRERVRNRALVGVTAAFALAASLPYFF